MACPTSPRSLLLALGVLLLLGSMPAQASILRRDSPALPLGLPSHLHHPQCPVIAHRRPVPFAAVAPSAGAVYEGALRSAALQGRIRPYEIYVPPDYRTAARRGRRYPVLYLLHGAPGGPTDWLCAGRAARTVDALIRAGSLAPLILVMPDGNGGPLRDTQYVNTFNGRDNAMDYLAHDVVGYIDAHYRTIADAGHRAIAGFSAGGYGAMNVGLHHPDVFHAIASMSGYYVALRNEVFGANDPFGHNAGFRRANSPVDYVAAVPGVRQLRLVIADTTNNLPYTRYSLQFDARLNALHIPHIFLLYRSTRHARGHSWTAWAALLPAILHALGGRYMLPGSSCGMIPRDEVRLHTSRRPGSM